MALLFSAHQILELACKKAYRVFHQQSSQMENVQREKLKRLMGDEHINYETFAKKFPLTRYADWKEKIEASRAQGHNLLNREKIIRFQPTSGSSEALKFIPYTQGFLDELDQAIGLWLTNLYLKHPQLKTSTHYWSVSWLPESQRKLTLSGNLNDDSALLNFTKRFLTKITQAVPPDIALAETAEDAMFATAVYLVADENLGMISVWSPTFALQLLEIIEKNRVEIAQVLIQGKWQRRSLDYLKAPKSLQQAEKLKQLDLQHPTAWKKLWTKLEIISSWDTASAEHWAKNLRERVADVTFEGKGLWATEGVVTIPLNGYYPLMYQSHFYEFIDLDTDEVLPAWDLKSNQKVSPVLTTSSGLVRYVIDDELVVNAFYQGIPCFKFLGRKMTVDLVGEKIDQMVALKVLETFKQDDYLPISLLGIEFGPNQKPHYVLLSEGNHEKKPTAQALDDVLKQNFHYELARNLGQLDEPKIRHVSNAWDDYKKIAMHNGMIEGNIKPEPIKKMRYMMEE